MLACALVVDNGWHELREGDRSVRELSDLLRSLPVHHSEARNLPGFRSAGSVSRKTTDLATNHPGYRGRATKGGRLDRVVIDAFLQQPDEMAKSARAIEEGLRSGALQQIPEQPEEVTEDGITALEGRLLARWAISRERDAGLRARKVKSVLALGKPIRCEVCTFDFQRFYGELGDGYIEVHHTLPLHVSGPRETQLKDLSLVCSNCHRMCHRGHLGKSWRTPADLRAELQKAGQVLRTQ